MLHRDATTIKGFKLYSIGGRLVVDDIYRYEDLPVVMEQISARLGLPEVPDLPRAEAGIRKDQRHYADVLSEQDRKRIEQIYAREFTVCNYSCRTS